jgi:hypothetical protein
MVITFFAPAQKTGRASKTPGSILGRHNLYKWVSFRSASTEHGVGTLPAISVQWSPPWCGMRKQDSDALKEAL